MSQITFNGVYPIGDTDPKRLPVKTLAEGIAWYTEHLGFEVVDEGSDGGTAVLRRDDVEIGLAVTGEDPEQASVYFDVSDVDAVRAELAAKGVDVSEPRLDDHGGEKYRVFFAKEPFGVCFCLGQPAQVEAS